MAGVVVPDSSYFIRSLRAGLDPFEQLAGAADTNEFATCGMVILEVCCGFRDLRVREQVRERFGAMRFIVSDLAVWDRAARIGWQLDREGIVLPATDLIIAACALEVDAAILTYDAHFGQVPGLRVTSSLK